MPAEFNPAVANETPGLSRTWKETAKAEGWTKFSIRALDDFAEDLVEIGDGVMTDE